MKGHVVLRNEGHGAIIQTSALWLEKHHSVRLLLFGAAHDSLNDLDLLAQESSDDSNSQ